MRNGTVVIVRGGSGPLMELTGKLREKGCCVLRGDERTYDLGVPMFLSGDVRAVIVDADDIGNSELPELFGRIRARFAPKNIILVSGKKYPLGIGPDVTVFHPPLDPRTVFRLLELEKPVRGEKGSPGRKLMYSVESVMISIGYDRRMKGFEPTREAVCFMVMHKGRIMSLASEVYPKVADKLSITPAAAERAIRGAIVEVWSNLSKGMRRALVSGCREGERSQPTNKSFLYAISDNVRKAHNRQEFSEDDKVTT